MLDGWCAALHVDYGLKGGLLVASIYLECGMCLGVKTDTWQRICRIGEMLTHYGKPFVLGGTGMHQRMTSVSPGGHRASRAA